MYQEWVVSDPRILFGKPTVKGTRISVELVLKQLAQSLDLAALVEAYPRPTLDDVFGLCLLPDHGRKERAAVL
ncbi:MAG: DUF433 domain-containing protein [Dehalococcoidia bacterium]